jgi:hypothetical protein
VKEVNLFLDHSILGCDISDYKGVLKPFKQGLSELTGIPSLAYNFCYADRPLEFLGERINYVYFKVKNEKINKVFFEIHDLDLNHNFFERLIEHFGYPVRNGKEVNQQDFNDLKNVQSIIWKLNETHFFRLENLYESNKKQKRKFWCSFLLVKL